MNQSQHQPLTAQDHADLRIATGSGAEFGDAVMSCITVPDEFRQVQADYPILFRLSDDRERFTALAIFGFENGENLFLHGDSWDAAYRPLAMAIQPFLIGGGPEGKQVHIDMGSARIGPAEGVRLFDESARPTPYLDAITEKLGQLDAGYQASGEFFEALQRHALIEPLTLEITLDDGSTNRMVGFHGIDEDRLSALDATALGELHAGGHLMPLFMAVASIGRIGDLVRRKNKRTAHG